MFDLFYEDVFFEFIDEVFVMMVCVKYYMFQVFIKCLECMVVYFQLVKLLLVSDGYMDWGWGEILWLLLNVWMGVLVEDCWYGVLCIDMLCSVLVVVWFILVELLFDDFGDVNFEGIIWLIVGGESGFKVCFMLINVVCVLWDKCVEEGVVFFFKQWGEWGLMSVVFNGVEWVGCKVFGLVLDGVDWKQFFIIMVLEVLC